MPEAAEGFVAEVLGGCVEQHRRQLRARPGGGRADAGRIEGGFHVPADLFAMAGPLPQVRLHLASGRSSASLWYPWRREGLLSEVRNASEHVDQ